MVTKGRGVSSLGSGPRVIAERRSQIGRATGPNNRGPTGKPIKGIQHRDVKPENILVRRDDAGRFVDGVLIDYGLASAIRSATLIASS